MADTFTIGALARAAGVAVSTVRFYERRGLLPEPPRRASGYRLYNTEAVERLHFIQQAKQLGFSLHEIAELLALRVQKGRSCLAVKRQATAKLADIEHKIRQLQHFQRALRVLVKQCGTGGPRGDCPILDALEHASLGTRR